MGRAAHRRQEGIVEDELFQTTITLKSHPCTARQRTATRKGKVVIFNSHLSDNITDNRNFDIIMFRAVIGEGVNIRGADCCRGKFGEATESIRRISKT